MAKKKVEESGEMKREIRGVVRIAGRDIKGETKLRKALMQIKGIGVTLSMVLTKVVSSKLGVPKDVMIGELSEEQVDKLSDIISNPAKYGVPERLLNRQRDWETDQSVHLVGSELAFRVKQDVTKMKELNTWKGFRHAYGQKVRGQRTRTTGRTGMTVGVLRKAMLAKMKEAKAGEEKKEEKKE
ncbi:MAG: 30S ribosomal protein S13 [Candidatus Micrarchaeia archaeon]